ncbi:arsenate reductase ArsC [Parablastomonas sp. CN1-191]|uniref:arsenate reductase ArsC n=1 Tax=Parablastomonas sp. CN1-191 TaxID=3400908 RepID=UPI003BF7E771
MSKVFNVLFLCTGNSARSIIAEATLNRLGQGRFKAYSAGSQPKGEVHPGALRLLERLDLDTSQFRSKSWSEFAEPSAPQFDFIFTVCDNAASETCPVWPGHPITAHWGIPDPAAVEGSELEIDAAFRQAHLLLSNRISLLTALSVDALDEASLRSRLNDIGKTEDIAK